MDANIVKDLSRSAAAAIMPNTAAILTEGAMFVEKAAMIGVTREELDEFMSTQTGMWDFQEAWSRLVLHVNGADRD